MAGVTLLTETAPAAVPAAAVPGDADTGEADTGEVDTGEAGLVGPGRSTLLATLRTSGVCVISGPGAGGATAGVAAIVGFGGIGADAFAIGPLTVLLATDICNGGTLAFDVFWRWNS